MLEYKIYGNQSGINIRPTTKDDTPNLVAWMNDPELQKTFVNQGSEFSQETLQKNIEKMNTHDKPSKILYSIYLGNQLIGMTTLRRINWEAKNAATSTFIVNSPDYRGKGYGTEAARLRLELAKDLGLRTLYARIHSDNIPNLKIHEKIGFKQVGKLSEYTVHDGQLVDALEFEVKL